MSLHHLADYTKILYKGGHQLFYEALHKIYTFFYKFIRTKTSLLQFFGKRDHVVVQP